MAAVAPYGSWPSPVPGSALVDRAVELSQLQAVGATLYWVEARPAEAGRRVVVRRGPDGQCHDVVPPGFSARTLVHEYGGRCYAVDGRALFFSNLDDQRVYRVELGGDPTPVPVTAGSTPAGSCRFADHALTPDGSWVVCVRERHGPAGVENDVVAVPADGAGPPRVLARGRDFYSSPRPSPDGRSVCWLSWDHPDMPWDATELWAAPLGPGRLAGRPRLVAGGPGLSVSQPRWSPESRLHYVADAAGWWNLHSEEGRCLAPLAAEFSGPDWQFGQCSYAFGGGALVAVWNSGGRARLGVVAGGRAREVSQPYSELDWVQPMPAGRVAAVAGSPTEAPAVVTVEVGTGRVEVVRRSRPPPARPSSVSTPELVEFATAGGATAYAHYYRPRHPGVVGPRAERPPLVVTVHGGPTAAARTVLDPGVQFWTSRGLAVAAVDYGGSTGYGRAYRERLRGRWGEVDVDDCVSAARHLAAEVGVDPRRTAIRGSSAGGYTALAALTFRTHFAAGASRYGVADLERLAAATHKFERHYLDGLVGPLPGARALYRERSPVHHADRLDRPVILLQGLEDRIVPPEQSEMMAAALRSRGVPVAYLAFPGEQHGFRQADNIVRAVEAELSFYGQVLGFRPAGPLEDVVVENLGSPASGPGGRIKGFPGGVRQ